MACDPRISERPRERGFILVAVLVFAALLASLLAGVLRMSSSYLFSAAAYSNVARADELGRTAADLVAQAVLSRDPNAKRGGSFVAHLKDADVYVNYVSETARVDVNAAQPELLIALFKAAGIDSGVADAVGQRIKTLRDQAAASDQPASAPGSTPPVQPNASQARIDNEAQIADVWGMNGEDLAKVAPYLTVANPSGKIDPTLAGGVVMAAVFDGDKSRADDFMRERAHGFATETDALLLIPLGARGYVDFTPAKAFRATVRVDLSNRAERRYQMVVVPPQKQGDDVKVIAWEAL
ncbi:MAG TPA: hypothetical protein VKV77_01475 [Methylovirgula sp.]|nr:hypothetical protein [Methylovirgula sp.]